MHHPSFHAQTTPDKPAYVIAETGETLTFAELDRRSNQGAQLFFSLGLKPGDHVALLMENGLPFVEICWAAQRAGLIFTTISRYLKADEIAYIVGDCEAKAFVTSPASAGETRKLLRLARRAAVVHDRRGRPGLSRLGRGGRRPAGDAGRQRIRRSRYALFLRHDRAGRKASRLSLTPVPLGTAQSAAETALRRHVRPQPGQRLSVAGAALSRRAACASP